jgi:hypothetical protein
MRVAHAPDGFSFSIAKTELLAHPTCQDDVREYFDGKFEKVQKWAKAYTSRHFSAGAQSTQRVENMNHVRIIFFVGAHCHH